MHDQKVMLLSNSQMHTQANTPREQNGGCVLLISPQPFFAHRGSPLRLKSTIQFLTKNGYTVEILAFPFGEDIQMQGLSIERGYRIPGIKNVKVGISPAKFLLDVGLAFKALRLTTSRTYVAIHGVEEAAFIALILGKLKNIPYVVDMHSDMSEQFAEHKLLKNPLFMKVFNYFFTKCLKHSVGALTVCDEHTHKVITTHNVAAYTARDLPLDFAEAFSAEKVLQIKNSLQLKNQKILLYAGNLAPYQGVDLLVRSFSKVINAKSDVNIMLVVLGGGPEEEFERQQLLALSKELGSADNIRFVPAIPVSETRHYFALADALISPRISGANTPLKIYSYLAAGKAIIATNISSHTQVLNEDCAYLCATEENDMTQKILAAFETSPNAIAQRNAMIQTAKEMVNLGKWIDDYEQAIVSLYANTSNQIR